MREKTSGIVGGCLLAFFLLIALFGQQLAPHDPTEYLSSPNQPPNAEFWFGTTGEGKDVFAQTVAGARISLLVGLSTGLAVMMIGALVGGMAGYFGGWLDDALSLLTNVFLIMPGLPLAVVLAGYLPQGPTTIALVLVVTGWAWNARVIRAQTLILRKKDFILAAVTAGETHLRIVVCEILPNMFPLLAAGFINATLYAIGAQVGLEFLGLGDASLVTWGTNLYWASNHSAIITGAWWTIIPTGLCVALVGFALTLLNSRIDAAASPKLRLPRAWGPKEREQMHLGMTPVVTAQSRTASEK